LGLSAWKVFLIAGVVVLLFLPRFIRMGSMIKGLSERFIPADDRDPPFGYARQGGQTIDGSTGLVVEPQAPVAKPSLAERIGMALARLVRMVTHRLSA
jgi:hypothetical protein